MTIDEEENKSKLKFVDERKPMIARLCQLEGYMSGSVHNMDDHQCETKISAAGLVAKSDHRCANPCSSHPSPRLRL